MPANASLEILRAARECKASMDWETFQSKMHDLSLGVMLGVEEPPAAGPGGDDPEESFARRRGSSVPALGTTMTRDPRPLRTVPYVPPLGIRWSIPGLPFPPADPTARYKFAHKNPVPLQLRNTDPGLPLPLRNAFDGARSPPDVFALTQPPADPPGKRGGLSPREVALAAQGFAHQPTSASANPGPAEQRVLGRRPPGWTAEPPPSLGASSHPQGGADPSRFKRAFLGSPSRPIDAPRPPRAAPPGTGRGGGARLPAEVAITAMQTKADKAVLEARLKMTQDLRASELTRLKFFRQIEKDAAAIMKPKQPRGPVPKSYSPYMYPSPPRLKPGPVPAERFFTKPPPKPEAGFVLSTQTWRDNAQAAAPTAGPAAVRFDEDPPADPPGVTAREMPAEPYLEAALLPGPA